MSNLNDIENEYKVEDKSSARCLACGSYEIGIEQAISKDGVSSTYYICEECGQDFL